MQALILEEPGCIRLQDVPIPQPGPGEILLRVKAATTCGTDLKAFLRGHPQIPMPGVFGHEYSGVVEASGEGAPFRPGDAVMGVHSAPCRKCRWCLRGQENLCETIMATKVLGAYAEYLLIPQHIAALNVFPKPDSLSFEKASLLEPLSCVMQAVHNIAHKQFDDVLILGPGAVGLMFVATLRRLGHGKITLAGRNQTRLETGAALGADSLKLEELGDRRFDLVVECTGAVEVWERSPAHVRRGGTAVLFGGCKSGLQACFDTGKLHYDQVDLVSPFHFGTRAVREAREFLMDPEFDLSPLLSGARSLEEGPRVFEDLSQGKGIKYVFQP